MKKLMSDPGMNAPLLDVRELNVRTSNRLLLRNVELEISSGQVLGIIGPSGAGNSTLLRALDRLTDLIPGLHVSGDVRLHVRSIHGPDIDVNALRARIGMLFQQPV